MVIKWKPGVEALRESHRNDQASALFCFLLFLQFNVINHSLVKFIGSTFFLHPSIFRALLLECKGISEVRGPHSFFMT